ncbi:metal ABC transporter substrate-binding protein [Actinomycetospora sp. NBRC 106375]|uniref:metal ABC transporter solute-binding protein, Zn/Mn family n=1 Tax=Actinomycetospora sp. NBRC 106375 TaxID=3032207 RepID=UPI0024A5C9A3|nr:zinc ABC transporter substrate-binding protein [Actinomycetospora sp. NBRC 106375]GLZ48697.1 metal ABC transporter substrate-binding protein [Actinomycetospora sp. NBRC 106375]
MPAVPRPVRRPAGLVAAVLGALLLVAGCSGSGDSAAPAPAEGRTLQVVATTNVWGSVVSAIAGPGVEVRSIIQDPAADPHSYESTPTDAAAITGADLVVFNGGGYDEWVTQTLDSDPQLRSRSIEAFALRGDQAEENEHVWFDPTAVTGVVNQVVERLSALEPAQAGALRERGAAFTARVDDEAARLAAIGQSRPGSRVFATEPIAHYLLATAGVADATPPAFSEAIENETDPPAGVVAEVGTLVGTRGVNALVFNPQTETPITEQLRTAATGAGVPVVDVTETLPAGQDYLTWVDGTRTALARALGAPA